MRYISNVFIVVDRDPIPNHNLFTSYTPPLKKTVLKNLPLYIHISMRERGKYSVFMKLSCEGESQT